MTSASDESPRRQLVRTFQVGERVERHGEYATVVSWSVWCESRRAGGHSILESERDWWVWVRKDDGGGIDGWQPENLVRVAPPPQKSRAPWVLPELPDPDKW